MATAETVLAVRGTGKLDEIETTHVQFGERASEKYCQAQAATRWCPTLLHVRDGMGSVG
jgi:hypothetical protein